MSVGRKVSQFQLVTGSSQIDPFRERIPILLMNQVGQQRSAIISPALLAESLGISTGNIDISQVVLLSGNQNISGDKNFYSRITINGTGVLLSGEVPEHDTGYLNLYLLKSETGFFYDNSNPSGFITGVDLSNYVVVSQLTGVSGFLQEQISDIDQLTGDFYLNSNPSGFITGIDLSSYSTISYVTGVSGSLQSQINNLSNETGNYITNSDTGQFYSVLNPSGYITNSDLVDYVLFSELTGSSGVLQDQINTLANKTGEYILDSETGQFYGSNNPSGFITGVDLSTYASINYVTGVSGSLQGQITSLNNKTGEYTLSSDTGNFITSSQTGQFYATTNPSGYITGLDLSPYSTIEYVTGVSGALQSQLNDLISETGNYVLDSETGQFYSSNNPNNYISTGDADSRFINITGNEDISGVKNFFSRVTINGTGILLSGEATVHDTGYLTGFITKNESGQFYSSSNPSGFITGISLSSGNWDTAFDRSITGLSISGTSEKIIFIFLQDGQIISGNFTDLQGSGDVDISEAVLKTGDQTINGLKSFSTRPEVNGSGVLLSGEAVSFDTGVLTDFVLKSETGNFYDNSNPSGFVTGEVARPYNIIEFLPTITGFTGSSTCLDNLSISGYIPGEKVVAFVYNGVPFELRHYYLIENLSGSYSGDGNGVIIPVSDTGKAWISL